MAPALVSVLEVESRPVSPALPDPEVLPPPLALLPPLTPAQQDAVRRIYDERIREHVHDRW